MLKNYRLPSIMYEFLLANGFTDETIEEILENSSINDPHSLSRKVCFGSAEFVLEIPFDQITVLPKFEYGKWYSYDRLRPREDGGDYVIVLCDGTKKVVEWSDTQESFVENGYPISNELVCYFALIPTLIFD